MTTTPKATFRIEIDVHDLGDLERIAAMFNGTKLDGALPADEKFDDAPVDEAATAKHTRKKTTRKKTGRKKTTAKKSGPTKADLGKAVNAAVKAHGTQPVRTVFEEYEAKVIDDIAESDYAEFIDALKNIEADDGFGA